MNCYLLRRERLQKEEIEQRRSGFVSTQEFECLLEIKVETQGKEVQEGCISIRATKQCIVFKARRLNKLTQEVKVGKKRRGLSPWLSRTSQWDYHKQSLGRTTKGMVPCNLRESSFKKRVINYIAVKSSCKAIITFATWRFLLPMTTAVSVNRQEQKPDWSGFKSIWENSEQRVNIGF